MRRIKKCRKDFKVQAEQSWIKNHGAGSEIQSELCSCRNPSEGSRDAAEGKKGGSYPILLHHEVFEKHIQFIKKGGLKQNAPFCFFATNSTAQVSQEFRSHSWLLKELWPTLAPRTAKWLHVKNTSIFSVIFTKKKVLNKQKKDTRGSCSSSVSKRERQKKEEVIIIFH